MKKKKVKSVTKRNRVKSAWIYFQGTKIECATDRPPTKSKWNGKAGWRKVRFVEVGK